MKYIRYILVFIASFATFFVIFNSIPFTILDVKDQFKGTAVTVDYIRVSRPSFVAVQTIDPISGLPDKGGFLNNPSLMPPGIYRKVNFTLTNLNGEIPDKVAVTLYEDTDNSGGFDGYYDNGEDGGFQGDKPVFNSINGKLFRKVITLK